MLPPACFLVVLSGLLLSGPAPLPASGTSDAEASTVSPAGLQTFPHEGATWSAFRLQTTPEVATSVLSVYSNVTSWVSQGLLFYDAAWRVLGGAFTIAESGSGGTAYVRWQVGDIVVEHGEVAPDGYASSFGLVHRVQRLPEEVFLIVWSAGPAVDGIVEVQGATVVAATHGTRAYAVAPADFAAPVRGENRLGAFENVVLVDGRHAIEIQDRLVGAAAPWGLAALALEDPPGSCPCAFYERDAWLMGRAGFVVSGEMEDLPLILAADVRLPDAW